jgi:predicted enzyme related to lactoylglutathione lyase
MLNLNSIMVCSANPKKLSEFYETVLGKPTFGDNDFTGWQAGSGWLMVGPHSEVKGRNKMPGRIMWNFETADVKAEFERIKSLGVKVKQEPYQPGESPDMWLATFEDPDGNYFQLASPMGED